MWISAQLLFFIVLYCTCEGKAVLRRCARLYSSEAHFSSDDEPDIPRTSSDDASPEIEICKKGFNSCYTVWEDRTLTTNVTTMVIIAQGCWESGADGCSSASVGCQADGKPPRARKNTRFCCCSTDLCNTNVTVSDSKPLIQQPTPQPRQHQKMQWERILLSGSMLGLACFVLCLSLVIVRKLSNLENRKVDRRPREQPRPPPLPTYPTNNNYSISLLALDRVIGQGRYGTVWLGSVREEQVAVKMYPVHYSQYYYNEKDIYSLPFMRHPNLLTYFGCDEYINKEGVPSYVIVVSYCPLGTLQDYLKNNVLDVNNFSNMSLSIAAGLAHLHTEIRLGDKWKPCISHRDVNTKNILVKSDLTCCLCDMGLAVKITGSKYYTLGEEQHAQTKSINDVGTLRYMAPEVLEGAVNLRDCESSLKQIDVYALGLVLWELAIRTADFYPKPSDVLPYTLPFQQEVGLHPSLESMQNVVCRNKGRLGWPSAWSGGGSTPYARLIMETVDDCTDQDGEARLTALCVHERISVFRSSVLGGGGGALLVPPSPPSQHHNHLHPTVTPNSEPKEDTEGYSEATCETIVTMSPSDGPQLTSVFSQPRIESKPEGGFESRGRNLCLERNLLASTTDSSEEVIHLSCKDSRSLEKESLIKEQSKRHRQSTTRSTAATVGNNHPPIPYLQNRPFSGVGGDKALTIVGGGGDKKKSPFSAIIAKPLKNILKKKKSHALILPPVKMEKKVAAERPSSLELEPRKPLKELSCRVKTPGDLPPSVRKKRARFSLYDDRIMSASSSANNLGSPPRPPPLKPFDSSF